MTVNRVTHVAGEVATQSTSVNRVSHVAGEVATQNTPENRVSQVVVEIVYTANAPVRATQVSVETLYENVPIVRATQVAVEVIRGTIQNQIYQVALEVIEDINPINSNTLKLCLPFDETVGESLTLDESPSRHPIDMTTGGLPTIDIAPSQFGGAAVNLSTSDYARAILPQPDFNFDSDFTIEFWIFRNDATDGHVMGQWTSTDKAWRILFNGSDLEFEWTDDGSTVNTEIITFDIPAVTWTHLAFENFGAIFTVYVDGLSLFNVASITPIHASNADLYIGKVESSTGGEEFNGSIDEIKIIVGEATFQEPFIQPIASVDCASIITPPDVNWEPGNLGVQDECSDSEFTIEITGLETVLGTQTIQAVGLPSGMVVDNFGNIIGVLPIHTAPPTLMNYEFQVTLFNNGVPILGPDTFSFDVRDQFLNDILQVTVPALYEPDDRTAWKNHLLNLIPNDNIYRSTDPAFGITLTPDLFIIDGLTEDDLTAFQTALAREDGKGPGKHKVIIDTLSFGTSANSDVLFYTINDPGSDVLTFPNPLSIEQRIVLPDPIEPISIDNIRDQLIEAIGFDPQFGAENLPDWPPIYQPVLIAAFVAKGTGQEIVDKFDDDAVHHVFKGRTVTIDRISLKRCVTIWGENGANEILTKFDDI